LGLKYHAGMSGVSAARRIFTILDTPLLTGVVGEHIAGVKEIAGAIKIPDAAQWGTGEISFERVSFRYPGRDWAALNDISFRILPGRLTALVGSTGAGKSTIANLLLRFIEPGAGCISVDGRALNSIPAEDWRKLVAWVPQNPYLFQESLAANLRLAKPQASENEMMKACQQAGLADFIISLPQGFETMAGERGARLSGGQNQRLALARAFLMDAPCLLLDEPTSSLDPGLEAELRESVQRLLAGRTALVIAHRLSTVYQADQIIVMDAGRIVETGNHSKLLAKKGRYAALVSGGGQSDRLDNLNTIVNDRPSTSSSASTVEAA